MQSFRDAVELSLAVALTASTFSALLALTALHGPPELPEIAPPSAPLTASFALPLPADPGPEEPDGVEVTEEPSPEIKEEARPARAPRPAPSAEGAGLPVPKMERALATAATGATQTAAGSKEPRRRARCLTPPSEIRAVGADRWEVDHSLLHHYMSDLDAAARLARLDWERGADGEVVGFTVRRLRCGSPLHAAGLRNGDVIHEVNGRSITSIPEALAAYARLKRGDRFRLDISRRGERRRLRYSVGRG